MKKPKQCCRECPGKVVCDSSCEYQNKKGDCNQEGCGGAECGEGLYAEYQKVVRPYKREITKLKKRVAELERA